MESLSTRIANSVAEALHGHLFSLTTDTFGDCPGAVRLLPGPRRARRSVEHLRAYWAFESREDPIREVIAT